MSSRLLFDYQTRDDAEAGDKKRVLLSRGMQQTGDCSMMTSEVRMVFFTTCAIPKYWEVATNHQNHIMELLEDGSLPASLRVIDTALSCLSGFADR